jgi:hypothetical protein
MSSPGHYFEHHGEEPYRAEFVGDEAMPQGYGRHRRDMAFDAAGFGFCGFRISDLGVVRFDDCLGLFVIGDTRASRSRDGLFRNQLEDHTEFMAEKSSVDRGTNDDDSPKHRMRLPHFIVDEPIGAGRVVKRVTSAVGVKPCGPCEQRAARLDRWLRIEPRG